MRRFLLITTALVYSHCILAQDVKTGEDESTVVLDNLNLGIDAGDASVTFKVNSLSLDKKEKNGSYKGKKLFWGLTAEGKNNEGVASIFSSSQIVPASRVTGMLGFSWVDDVYVDSLATVYETNVFEADDKYNKEFKLLTATLVVEIETIISDSVDALIGRENANLGALNKLKSLATDDNRVGLSPVEKLLKEMVEDTSLDNSTRLLSAQLLKSLFTRNPEYKRFMELDKLKKKAISDYDVKVGENYGRSTFFIHYSNSAVSYNTFLGWDSTNLANSFKSNTFRGISMGIGFNRDWKGKNFLGFKYTYEETNNLAALRTTDYVVRTNNVAANQTGTTEIKKTAYPNQFQNVFLHNIDLDVLQKFDFDDKYRVLVDYYVRINASTDNEKLPSFATVGVSSSFYNAKKGRFIGGVYVEVPDLNQDIERSKPRDQQELEPLYRRLSFGIYTKFSFTGLSDDLL